MLLPMIFPIPISWCPFLIAMTEVINSGSDVPIAIIVRPIILSEIPNDSAIATALSTVKMAPAHNSPIPNATSSIR